MRFYYFSLFSWMLYLIVVLGAIGLLTLVWVGLFKLKFKNSIYWILVAGIMVLPWGEELWIAYNFDRLCRKDAGVFVSKVVEVDGFYDDTHGWRPDKLRASGFKFVEGRDQQVFWRHEYVGNEIRSMKIDKPTARYQYKARWSGGSLQVAHKIKREDASVVDTQTGEVLGQYVAYSRGPYWFFISSGAPTIVCQETLAGTRKYGSLIYLAVLKPSKQ